MGTQVKKPKAYSYIRLSTALQRKGHGRQRQFDKSAAYAAANNLDLSSDTLEDIGVSAYKGKNLTEGVLGGFIELARAGKIERGSVLLVESLDRLSRQQVEKALRTFLNILDAGITIVTLGDGDRRTYVPGKVDVSDLVMTIMIMGRAHEESQTKADRIKANWAKKRANARAHRAQPMTATCPAWLELSKDRKSYREIETRVETIRWIFDQAASGLGIYAINRRLNEQKRPHFGKSNGWHQSYLIKILNNRAVLGEFQPHKLVNDKRQPEGDPIPNYFPAIVSKDIFDRVQYGLAQRRTAGAGRKGKYYSNLFSGLPLKCAQCNGSVKFENKGSGPKGGFYLVCDNTRRGNGCSMLRWRYEHFEASVLYFLHKQIDLPSLVQGFQEGDRRHLLNNAIEVLEAKCHQLELRYDRRLDLMDTMDVGRERLSQALEQIAVELRQSRDELAKLVDERTVLINEAAAIGSSDIRSLVESLQTADESDRYALRSDLAANLRKLVGRIDLKFMSQPGLVRSKIKDAAVSAGESLTDEELEMMVRGENSVKFTITFKNGHKADSRPAIDDPFTPLTMLHWMNLDYLAGRGYDVTDPEKAEKQFAVDQQWKHLRRLTKHRRHGNRNPLDQWPNVPEAEN